MSVLLKKCRIQLYRPMEAVHIFDLEWWYVKSARL
jgi:hypothetical protein